MSDIVEALKELTLFAVIAAPIWAVLVRKRLREGSFLPYTPRWPVPWGPVGAFLAIGFLILSLLEAGASSGPADQAPAQSAMTADQFVQFAVLSAVLNLGLVFGLVVFFLKSGRSTLSDVGLPEDGTEVLSDLRLGVVTALASLLPVYALQVLLVVGLGVESEHPTLLQLLNDSNPLVLLAAWLTAGVVAPVFEEFVFRLLFQGWMERVEDEALGIAGRLTLEEGEDDGQEPEPKDEIDAGRFVDSDNPYASPQVHTLRRLRRRRGTPPTPPEETFAGLPHGWGPILISSFVFALLHLSQGAAVGPLFILALMLGYLYQRTHRITPSIFAHMTFNTISLLAAYATAHAS
ncbi:CAAX amino terminal protease self- immunity [Posidoniimonas corsicana]|uniref:CAAX amino terminal protease self-immunity n=1 Tax=Posidoniimonas corsicana TaxID=1938618 RepID=A0A5C5VCR7_9BACT|nr:CPBP family intramembrane glutamic endopeptidase [Posidoniimonas corsicana]TWT36386.1 CAAX amino terminal protease self- immunity [Posidoniimonas corsicana]